MSARNYIGNCLVALAIVASGACARPDGPDRTVDGGDADRGRTALIAFECGACHRIGGIPGARGHVGPPLDDYRDRVYIAGRHPNDPEWLVRWIRHAPSLDAQTAMPDLGVSDAEARDIAAYLYR
jgi:mono/diheme cytochrome c family protein